MQSFKNRLSRSGLMETSGKYESLCHEHTDSVFVSGCC
jgi:hypothetical protein